MITLTLISDNYMKIVKKKKTIIYYFMMFSDYFKFFRTCIVISLATVHMYLFDSASLKKKKVALTKTWKRAHVAEISPVILHIQFVFSLVFFPIHVYQLSIRIYDG